MPVELLYAQGANAVATRRMGSGAVIGLGTRERQLGEPNGHPQGLLTVQRRGRTDILTVSTGFSMHTLKGNQINDAHLSSSDAVLYAGPGRPAVDYDRIYITWRPSLLGKLTGYIRRSVDKFKTNLQTTKQQGYT